ncbi:MAG: hypothetical protein E6Q78_04450 [Rhodoferax sp.]|nr:MAG: hypothetical protein E6Q78_04450 [Rhodoferax sp.]
MNADTALRVLALCVVLAGTETLHGIARTLWLAPRVGKARATQLSIVSGSLLAFAVCYLLVPGVGLVSLPDHLALGAVLALFMAGFDAALGKWLLRRSWRKILDDFNPATGNYLLFGLALLVVLPLLVALLRSPL